MAHACVVDVQFLSFFDIHMYMTISVWKYGEMFVFCYVINVKSL